MPAFKHTFAIRFADVDHAGIVYYPRFFHYFHVAFEEFFRTRVGATAYVDLVGLIGRERIGFPAVHAECDYRAPLRFGDTVTVAMSVAHLGARSIRFRYRVILAEGQSGPVGQLCAEGAVVCVVTDLDRFVSVRVPDRLRPLFLELADDPE